MAKSKATRHVRVRLDIVLELNEPVDTLPFGGPEHADALIPAVAKMCAGFDRRVIGWASGSAAHVSLDYRRKD